MDKLLGLISSLETAIRYVLTGIAVVTTVLLAAGKTDATQALEWIISHQLPAAVATIATGVACYALYRTVMWTIADGLAHHLKVSAPPRLANPKASHPKWLACECWYHRPYALFLRSRYRSKVAPEAPSDKTSQGDAHSEQLAEPLSTELDNYLKYRWAVAHFVLLSGIASAIAWLCMHRDSVMANHPRLSISITAALLVAGLWQCFFLFRVEAELLAPSTPQK